ncbi:MULTISPECIES: hypothetical protein [Methylobacter]
MSEGNDANVRADKVEELAGKVVALIKAELPNDYKGEIASDAVLLAQYRLFGSYYLSRLLSGLYPLG